MSTTAKAMVLLLFLGCQGGPSGDVHLLRVASFATGIHPNDGAIGDFDGDGDSDVVVPGLVSSHLATLWNSGGALEYSLESPLDRGASGAVAIDLDDDGVDELLLSNREWGAIEVLTAASGTWQRIDQLDVAGAEQIRAADLDGDGLRDLAITRFDADELHLLFGLPGGGFGDPVAIALHSRPQGLTIVSPTALGPLIAVSEARADSVALVALRQHEWQVVGRVNTPAWPASLGAIDVDGDGVLEVVGAANLGSAIFVLDDLLEEPSIVVTGAGAGALGVAGLGGVHVVVSNKLDDTLMLFEGGADGLELSSQIDTEPGPSPIYPLALRGTDSDHVVVIDAFADSVTVFEVVGPSR